MIDAILTFIFFVGIICMMALVVYPIIYILDKYNILP